MHLNHFFLDTEWADADGAELVSLALVSVDGAHRFYAERDPLPSSPTAFVARHVYPLLDRGDAALSDAQFTAALRTFLTPHTDACVLFDCHNDGVLYRRALEGLDDSDVCPLPIPRLSLTLMHRGHYLNDVLEAWFAAHPTRSARRHHAAVDAEALRQAWIFVTRDEERR